MIQSPGISRSFKGASLSPAFDQANVTALLRRDNPDTPYNPQHTKSSPLIRDLYTRRPRDMLCAPTTR